MLGEDYLVVTPDLPGTGKNPELEQQNLEGYVKWLHGYIADLGVKPIMVGHSMGSIIVSHYVEKYPETVAQDLILMSPILRGPGAKAANMVFNEAVRGVLFPFSPELKKKILASKRVSWMISHSLTADKSKQKAIDEMHYEYAGQFVSARSLYCDMDISASNDTKMPLNKRMLVLFGKKDKLSNCKLVRERVREVGAEYFEFDSAGHLINYERPEEVAERIREFLGARR